MGSGIAAMDAESGSAGWKGEKPVQLAGKIL
jgi:hypothetical protein